MNRKFVINNSIIFTPADGMLRAIDSDLELFLPPATARLLLMLLERNDEVLSQDELCTQVWENYGLRGSLHNLTHSTMIIRKAFKSLSLSEQIITTIHKKGLRINPAIDVSVELIALADLKAGDQESESFETTQNIPHASHYTRCLNVIKAFFSRVKFPEAILYISTPLVVIAFIGVITRMGYYSTDNEEVFSFDSLRLFKEDRGCKFYTFNGKAHDAFIMADIKEKTKKFNMHCVHPTVIIYFSDMFLGPNVTGKRFHSSLTICTESENVKSLHSCVSHYYN